MLFSNFVAAVNCSLHHQRITFNYPNSSKLLFIVLDLLIVEGLVSSYSTYTVTPNRANAFFLKLQKKLRAGISIFFHLKKGRYGIFYNAQVISTPGWFKFVSYYKLRTILFKAPSSIFLLSASGLGYVGSVFANKVRSGGKLILRLN